LVLIYPERNRWEIVASGVYNTVTKILPSQNVITTTIIIIITIIIVVVAFFYISIIIRVLGFDSPRGWEFSLHHSIQNGSGAHPASYPMGTGGHPLTMYFS
jgi:hypothetical protein